MFIFLLILNQCLSDDLYWVDYDTSQEYNWESLQSLSDYTLETDSTFIIFNFGKNIEKTCQGQSASAISFSKSNDFCIILGRHEVTYLTPFSEASNSGIVLFYEGGSVCKNRYFNDFKHRIEFKFTCSEVETEFVLSSDANQCTSIVERKGKCGCSQEYTTSLMTKIVLFSIYSVLGIILIWICVESFDENSFEGVGVVSFAKTKILASNSKDSYDVV